MTPCLSEHAYTEQFGKHRGACHIHYEAFYQIIYQACADGDFNADPAIQAYLTRNGAHRGACHIHYEAFYQIIYQACADGDFNADPAIQAYLTRNGARGYIAYQYALSLREVEIILAHNVDPPRDAKRYLALLRQWYRNALWHQDNHIFVVVDLL